MRVAICYTKDKATPLYRAFASGLREHGDTWLSIGRNAKPFRGMRGSLVKGRPFPSDSVGIMSKLEKCDLSMQFCETYWQSGRCHNVLAYVKKYQQKLQKRRLVFEVGFVHAGRRTPLNERYFQIGYDGMKGLAECYNTNQPNDRWRDLNASVKPWRQDGSHILIMGQNVKGASSRQVDLTKWWGKAISNIRKLTDRPIKMRPHPGQIKGSMPRSDIKYKITRGTKIEDDLRDCWCVVARTTNAAVDAIVNGIPVITPDRMCMTYDISSHSIKDINDPATPDRTQWFNDLAYAQWSLEEIEAGIPWGRLRGFANV